MAGVGFTLRRMLADGGYTGPLKAFACAALVSSGPWLASSVALALLSTWGALVPGSPDNRIFLALVSYAYAFSLIGSGLVQMVASRFLADRLYEKRYRAVAPAFAQLLIPLLLGQMLVGGVFLAFVPIDMLARVAALALYLALNGIWLSMVFLSATRDYRRILAAFGWGLAASLLAGWLGGHLGGLGGELAGYALGHALTFFLLLGGMDRLFGMPRRPTRRLRRDLLRFWPLMITGLAYNLGAWIDKILFWYDPSAGQTVVGALRSAPVYDNAMFLAYLTIVPALALFLLKVETDFYDRYRSYLGAISTHSSLGVLTRCKEAIVQTLRADMGMLLKVQGTLTVGLMLFSPELLQALHVSWLSTFVFRTGVLGAMLHGLHLVVLILLLYFDFQGAAALLSLAFLGSNALLSWMTLHSGLATYGYGYTISCALTLLLGLALLDRALERLEFHVFMRRAGG